MRFGDSEPTRVVGTVIRVDAAGLVYAEFGQDGGIPMYVTAPAESFTHIRTTPEGGPPA
jgi:hypothetical protein